METDIHNKDFALRLVLKERLGELGTGLLSVVKNDLASLSDTDNDRR